jgi:hypothetical protein
MQVDSMSKMRYKYHSIINGDSNLSDVVAFLDSYCSHHRGERVRRLGNSLISSKLVEELHLVLSSLKKLALGLKKFLITFLLSSNPQFEPTLPYLPILFSVFHFMPYSYDSFI